MYAMKRANGDWFALDDGGHLRVPVFRSSNEAMEARTRNPGMLLFRPVVIDESALDDLSPAETETISGFWLVSNPSVSLRHGHPIEHAQLAQLLSECAQAAT
jgi:hypothetical protein